METNVRRMQQDIENTGPVYRYARTRSNEVFFYA